MLSTATLQGRETVPDAKGKAVVQKLCVGCHSISVVSSKRATPAEWSTTVQQMVARGAEGTDEEIEIATRYLSENFTPQSSNPPSLNQPETASPSSSQASIAPRHDSDVTAARLAQPETPDLDSGIDKSDSVRVNINSATTKELAASLSLTSKEADTLIAFRKQNGRFSNWQDVAEVPGVPAGKIQELRTRIVF